ncbi:MAG: cyclohydrolase, partial [Pseudomonadota bacterium]
MADAAPDALDAARVVDAVRRGWPVRISGADGALLLLPVEGADDAALAAFASGAADVLISGERAATLKLTNQRAAAAPGPVCIAGFDGGVAAAVALADPALDLAHPFKGPFATKACPAPDAAAAAIILARHAGRLPAFFIAAAG